MSSETGTLTDRIDRVSDRMGPFAYIDPLAVISVVGVIVVWQALSMVLNSAIILPSFTSVIIELWEMALDGALFEHLQATLIRVFVGFFAAIVVGVLVAFPMGMSQRVEGLLEPFISFGYPVPKVALYPLFLIVFGFGHLPKILLVFIECLIPIIVASYYGVRDVDRIYVWSARNFDANRWTVFRDVILPASLPYVFSGIRTALPIAFIIAVVTELISSTVGIGYLIAFSSGSLNHEGMFVGFITIGAVGFLLDRLLMMIRQRALFWAEEVDSQL